MQDRNSFTNEQVRYLIEDIIGLEFSPAVLEVVKAITGRYVRVIGLGNFVTMDFRHERLNLTVSDCNIITAISFC